jgi:hypothetical protein
MSMFTLSPLSAITAKQTLATKLELQQRAHSGQSGKSSE